MMLARQPLLPEDGTIRDPDGDLKYDASAKSLEQSRCVIAMMSHKATRLQPHSMWVTE